MKAKIKATGEIVHVGDYNTIYHDPMYKDERTGPWRLEELDFNDTADYWTRLEHQAAIATMGGICGNTKYDETTWSDMAEDAIRAAHALVEKMKEERK